MSKPKQNARLIAAENGALTFSSKRCRMGHKPTRYTSNGGCVQCAISRARNREARINKLLKQQRGKS